MNARAGSEPGDEAQASFDDSESRTVLVPPELYASMMFDELTPDSEPRTRVRDMALAPMAAPEPPAAPPPQEPRRRPVRWAKTVRLAAVQPPPELSRDVETTSALDAVPASIRGQLDEMSMVLPPLRSPEWIANATDAEIAAALSELRRSEGIEHVLPPPHVALASPSPQRTGLYLPPRSPQLLLAGDVPPPPYVAGPVEGWYPPHHPAASEGAAAPAKRRSLLAKILPPLIVLIALVAAGTATFVFIRARGGVLHASEEVTAFRQS